MEDNQPTQADASTAGEDKAGTEAVDGIPPATSDDTYPAENENNGTTEDPSNEDPSKNRQEAVKRRFIKRRSVK